MQHSVSLTGCFKQLIKDGHPALNNKPGSEKESYVEFLAGELLENNRTFIDWLSRSMENKNCREDSESGLYDKLIHDFLCNFSTFKRNE